MNKALICKKLVFFILLIIAQAKCFAKDSTRFEIPRTETVAIKDTFTGRSYELYVKLPKDYSDKKNTQYPVIYTTDAIWHFEILSASTEFMLEDVILVGISWQTDIDKRLKDEVGEHVSRFRDYSISEHADPEIQKKYQLGHAEKHLRFIREDVLTLIEQNYRADPQSRSYIGYSLGGEFGTYILLTQPDTFNNYIIGSPSIKTDVSLLSELNSKFGPFKTSDRSTSLNANVFISYGSLEHDVVAPIDEFIGVLKSRRDLGLALQKQVIEGTHQTAFPMTAVRGIAWLSTLIRGTSNHNDELSFLEIPQLNNAFINATPEERDDNIAVGELGIDGGNKETIMEFAQEIANHEHGRFSSFLIGHKDKLVFESYYGRGRINQPHQQASATKAYLSLLLGRAIQLGYLTMSDLEKPLVSMLDKLDSTNFVSGVETITLNKALTMRGGLTVDRDKWAQLKKTPEALTGQKQVQALFEISEPVTPDSQNFSYGSYNPDLVMQVIEAKVPETALEFLAKEFFGKMGITNYRWKTTVSGVAEADERAELTSRDMAKIGILVKNKGKWNGEQLIPEAYIAKAIAPQLYTDDDYKVHYGGKDVSNQGYGYFWWNADLKSGDKTYYSSSAQGGWGQFVVLIEELDLIVVFTGIDNDTNYLQLTAERVLPAFVKQ
ncbi:MAG: serine hydrolase [Acidiferrobacterales bacterium]|nr:serine hydrolase [Acidiferrobacterales bacterium]